MAQETRAQCPTCNTEIVPGTLYCWNHNVQQPVAEFRTDNGQLLWVTKSKRLAERAVALVIRDEQMAIMDAVPLLDQKPACIRLYYREPGADTPQNGDEMVDISLSELFEGFLAGAEFVDGTRSVKA